MVCARRHNNNNDRDRDTQTTITRLCLGSRHRVLDNVRHAKTKTKMFEWIECICNYFSCLIVQYNNCSTDNGIIDVTPSTDATMDERKFLSNLFLLWRTVLSVYVHIFFFVAVGCIHSAVLRCYLIFAFNESSLTNGLTCDFSWLARVPESLTVPLCTNTTTTYTLSWIYLSFIFPFFFFCS